MSIPILFASSYQKRMSSGRTKPCLFLCEDDSGDQLGEYVVKLKAGIEHGVNGLVAELLSAQLAKFLDIPVPEPALIQVDPAITEVISDQELADKIRNSAGSNYGSRLVTGGFETWPIGKALPMALKQLATEIFAFDALIQNPDRRDDKPNVLWRGDDLYIIDHEMSFSFIYGILLSSNPRQLSGLPFLRKHLFYQGLKGREVSLDRFAGALETLSEEVLDEMISNIPEEWRNDNISKMATHIIEISSHTNEFIDELRRVIL